MFLKSEPNVVRVNFPATVLGDIHGQVFDLIRQFEEKSPETSNFVFLGDYIDRGSHSIEVLLLLLALKVRFTSQITLLRGNHETRLTSEHFTFRAEVLSKYDDEVYQLAHSVFDAMPLVAMIGGDYLCVHGGISPNLKSMKSLDAIDRFNEPPDSGLFCDLLWADPAEDRKADEAAFYPNSTRGCSVNFGYQPLKTILDKLGAKMLLRGHEVQQEGFKMYKWKSKEEPLPLCCTIFSAPNYCGVYQNKGASLVVSRTKFTLKTFGEVEPPYYIGSEIGGGNVFAHGLEQISSTVLDVFSSMLKKVLLASKVVPQSEEAKQPKRPLEDGSDDDLFDFPESSGDEEDDDGEELDVVQMLEDQRNERINEIGEKIIAKKKERKNSIRTKIGMMSNLSLLLKQTRNDSQSLSNREKKLVSLIGKNNPGKGRTAKTALNSKIKNAQKEFASVQNFDRANEMRPKKKAKKK